MAPAACSRCATCGASSRKRSPLMRRAHATSALLRSKPSHVSTRSPSIKVQVSGQDSSGASSNQQRSTSPSTSSGPSVPSRCACQRCRALDAASMVSFERKRTPVSVRVNRCPRLVASLRAASKAERARRASGPSVGWPSLAHTAVQRSSGACGPSACCPRASWRRRQSRSSSGAFGPR